MTRYRYRRPVAFGEHRMMFRPLESYDQRVLSSILEISPEPSWLQHVHDVFGNAVGIALNSSTGGIEGEGGLSEQLIGYDFKLSQ